MAGHSKWANIKRKKEANDGKRSKEFSKVSRLISVAVKKEGGDVNTNPALRLAVEKAKHARMSKDTVDKTIAKALGNFSGVSYEEVVYEGYAPFGVALLMLATTDNNNRTVSEIRALLSKFGGTLGDRGSTSYIFDTVTYEPSFTIDITDQSGKEKVCNLLERLGDHDDIQDIYFNAELEL